jgi:hypothetical protein
MQLHKHLIASTVISAGIYAATRSPEAAVGSFAAGVFIDIDHVLDYWIQHPFKLDLVHFFATCEEYKLKKTYLFLHSFEFILPLALLVYYTRSPWLAGMALGWSQHVIFDYFNNFTTTKGYFLIYRALHGFNIRNVFTPPDERGANG